MISRQARELLSSGLPPEQVLAESATRAPWAARLGESAQLLQLVYAFLRERVIDGGDTLRQAIIDADDRLSEQQWMAFYAHDEDDRTRVVAHTINLSLDLLDGPN
jgi:hypothetical protein